MPSGDGQPKLLPSAAPRPMVLRTNLTLETQQSSATTSHEYSSSNNCNVTETLQQEDCRNILQSTFRHFLFRKTFYPSSRTPVVGKSFGSFAETTHLFKKTIYNLPVLLFFAQGSKTPQVTLPQQQQVDFHTHTS